MTEQRPTLIMATHHEAVVVRVYERIEVPLPSVKSLWYSELLEDLPRSRRPAPFIEIEHDLPKLEVLFAWLGKPEVETSTRHR